MHTTNPTNTLCTKLLDDGDIGSLGYGMILKSCYKADLDFRSTGTNSSTSAIENRRKQQQAIESIETDGSEPIQSTNRIAKLIRLHNRVRPNEASTTTGNGHKYMPKLSRSIASTSRQQREDSSCIHSSFVSIHCFSYQNNKSQNNYMTKNNQNINQRQLNYQTIFLNKILIYLYL